MLCDRCHERDATVRVEAVSPDGALLRATILCEACAALPPARITDPDVESILELEASGHAVPPGLFARAAAEFARRAAAQGDAMPPAVQAFIDRHRPAAT